MSKQGVSYSYDSINAIGDFQVGASGGKGISEEAEEGEAEARAGLQGTAGRLAATGVPLRVRAKVLGITPCI